MVQKLSKNWAILILILGIVLLLKDLGYANWWAIAPWTLVFLLIGLIKVLGK